MNLLVLLQTPIKKGFVYLVDMNPGRKSKPGKVRPVVVIQSSDTLEAGSPGVVIVPCTTQLRETNILRLNLSPSPTLKIEKSSDVLLDQIHTIDRTLFIKELGSLAPNQWEQLEEGIHFLLD